MHIDFFYFFLVGNVNTNQLKEFFIDSIWTKDNCDVLGLLSENLSFWRNELEHFASIYI